MTDTITTEVRKTSFATFAKETKAGGYEGIVVHGAGGNLQEWVDGIDEMLFNEGISPELNNFGDCFELTDHYGVTHLAMLFKVNDNKIILGKMALWRLRFGECSWISDFTENYKKRF